MPFRFISPKSDISVKELMENPIVRNQFISDVTKIPLGRIKGSRLRNTYLRRRHRRRKLGILDILVELVDGTKINIEKQVLRSKDWDKRALFYLAKIYVDDLQSGQDYGKLKKCIHIGILDFNLTEDGRCHSVYRMRDENGREFSDQLELHTIELNKTVSEDDRINDWIAFFNATTEEELDMLSNRSIGLREAVRELREMSLTKYLRALYEERQKEIRDRKAIIGYAWEEGRTKGLEEGREILTKALAKEQANTERERLRADLAEEELRRLQKDMEHYKKES